MAEPRRFTRLLGEFTVIVVGVFMALAADSWYQGWSESRGLEGYLERLIVDLEADSSTYRLVLDALDEKDAALHRVAKVSLRLEQPDSIFFADLARTQYMGFRTPGARRATYEDLLATGNLRLVRDPVIRRALVEYYSEVEGKWIRINERRTDYPQAVYRLDPSPWQSPDFATAYPSLAAQAMDSIRTKGFANLLSAERTLSMFQRERVAEAMSQLLELLATVRASLNNGGDG